MSDRHVIQGKVKQYLPEELNHFRIIDKNEWTYVDIKEHGGSEEVTDTTIFSEQVPIEETEWYKEQSPGLAYYKDVLVVFKGPKGDIPHLAIKEGTRAIVSDACALLTKTEIDIPDSVENIGENAFEKVPNINYHGKASGSPWGAKCVNGCIDGDFVFTDATKTTIAGYIGSETDIIIPQGVKEIGDKVFYYKMDIQSIDIPDTVERIGQSAFGGCKKLGSIRIPNGITKIEDGTFNGCTSLKTIDIPETVEEIGWSVFEDCRALCSIKIPNGIKEIGGSAFSCCDSLFSISIPEGITEIKRNTFYNCTSLESVDIPETVEEIGWSAFEGCQALRSIIIPNGIKQNNAEIFKGCKSLESVDIPNLPSSKLGYKWDFRDSNDLKCINIHQVSDERNIWSIVLCGQNVEIKFLEDEKTSTTDEKPSTIVKKSILGKIHEYLFTRKKQ